jgi:hypothetical protein
MGFDGFADLEAGKINARYFRQSDRRALRGRGELAWLMRASVAAHYALHHGET